MKTNKKSNSSEKSSEKDSTKKQPAKSKRSKKPSILDEFDEFGDIDFDIPEPIDGIYDDDDDDLY